MSQKDEGEKAEDPLANIKKEVENEVQKKRSERESSENKVDQPNAQEAD